MISCDSQSEAILNHKNLANLFNSAKRYPRFINTNLIFGDTINLHQKVLLHFHTTWLKEKIYSKAAYQISNGNDSIIYFMYGLSKEEKVLNELRIRSFRKDSFLGDFLIVDLDKDHSLNYDYWYEDYLFDHPALVVQAMNDSEETHYSFYLFYQGKMIDKTIVPDTIFRRDDIIPSNGQAVKVYDDFQSKTLTIRDKKNEVSGRISQVFRGEDCSRHIIVELDDSLLDFRYIYFDETLSDISNLYGLQSDSLMDGKEACLKESAKPLSELILIKEKVYIDY